MHEYLQFRTVQFKTGGKGKGQGQGRCQGPPRPARLVKHRLRAPAATVMASQSHTPRALPRQLNHGLMRAPDCHQVKTRSGHGRARPLHACGIQNLPTRANFTVAPGHGWKPPTLQTLPT